MKTTVFSLLIYALLSNSALAAVLVTNVTPHIQAVGVEFDGKSFVVRIKPKSRHLLRGHDLVLHREGQEPIETYPGDEFAILPNNRLVRTATGKQE